MDVHDLPATLPVAEDHGFGRSAIHWLPVERANHRSFRRDPGKTASGRGRPARQLRSNAI